MPEFAPVSRLSGLLRQTLRAASLLLLLASHLAASTIAADCASRCAHTCCRASNATRGAGTHCAMAGHAAMPACGLKARCTHTQQSAITALPLLAATERPLLRRPEANALAMTTLDARTSRLARSIDSPPPRLLA